VFLPSVDLLQIRRLSATDREVNAVREEEARKRDSGPGATLGSMRREREKGKGQPDWLAGSSEERH